MVKVPAEGEEEIHQRSITIDAQLGFPSSSPQDKKQYEKWQWVLQGAINKLIPHVAQGLLGLNSPIWRRGGEREGEGRNRRMIYILENQ